MRELRVGHEVVSAGVVVKVGTYASLSRPADAKAFPQVVMSIPSGLVNKIVRTAISE
jgi:hypothetical protein